MKRISVFLSLILLLTSLSSCAVISDRSNPSSESDSNTIDSRTQTAPGQTAESSATTDTAHTDITSYLQYFVSYFHEPYQRGDAVTQNNLLYLSFLFCFSNRDLLDFVEIDEEKSLMSIPEKELERISSDLIRATSRHTARPWRIPPIPTPPKPAHTPSAMRGTIGTRIPIISILMKTKRSKNRKSAKPRPSWPQSLKHTMLPILACMKPFEKWSINSKR